MDPDPSTHRDENLDVLNFATRLLLASTDRRGLTRTALETLADFSQSQRLALLVYDMDKQRFQVAGVWSGSEASFPDMHFPADTPHLAPLLTRKSAGIFRLQWVDDVPMPAGEEGTAPPCCLLLPVVAVHGKLIGQVVLDLGERTSLERARMQPLRVLNTVIAMALENVRMIEEAVAESKARYRAIVEHSAYMVVRLTPGGEVAFANNTFCRALGADRPDVVGRPFVLSVPDSEQAVFETMRTALTPDMEPRTYAFRITLPDGAIQWNEWTVSTITDEQGDFMEYQAIGRDTTLQRLAEEERRAIEQKMLDAQKMESLGLIAGGVAHDFNNLLATILGNTELALETPGASEEVIEYLEETRKATRKAADLSREMLLYAGQHPMMLRPLNVNDTIQQIHHLIEANLSRQAEIIYKLSPDEPEVLADPAQVHQLLVNLVTNADEALEGKPGTITISSGAACLNKRELQEIVADVSLKEGDYTFIEVADTGCGIAHDAVRQIFEPFFSSKFIGRGLGLAAVHGIMRGHEGAIRVVSRPGDGSAFTLYFPVSTRSATATARSTA